MNIYQNSEDESMKHRPKMNKIEVLYFLELQKFEKIKWSYFSHFWPPGRDIDNVCFLQVYIFS